MLAVPTETSGLMCRDRTCGHLIKSQVHKSAFQTAITLSNAYCFSHNFFYLGCFYTIF